MDSSKDKPATNAVEPLEDPKLTKSKGSPQGHLAGLGWDPVPGPQFDVDTWNDGTVEIRSSEDATTRPNAEDENE